TDRASRRNPSATGRHHRFEMVDHSGRPGMWAANHRGSSDAVETVTEQPRNPVRLAAGHSGLLLLQFFEHSTTGWIERGFGACRRLPRSEEHTSELQSRFD